MDFEVPIEDVALSLVAGRAHYEIVISRILEARSMLWIATANLKELMVESGKQARGSRYRSVLTVFETLVARGVEIRILHASLPSRAFRNRFDSIPLLVEGGIQMRMCPRTHFKAVVVDAEFAYIGSANWTGAGLGAKGKGRRNFELGITTQEDAVLDQVQSLFETVWSGNSCKGCTMRANCEQPIDEM